MKTQSSNTFKAMVDSFIVSRNGDVTVDTNSLAYNLIVHVHAALNAMPDNFIYTSILNILSLACESSIETLEQFQELDVSCLQNASTSALLEWVSSSSKRMGYCDAASELYGNAKFLETIIQGQVYELQLIKEYIIQHCFETRHDESHC